MHRQLQVKHNMGLNCSSRSFLVCSPASMVWNAISSIFVSPASSTMSVQSTSSLDVLSNKQYYLLHTPYIQAILTTHCRNKKIEHLFFLLLPILPSSSFHSRWLSLCLERTVHSSQEKLVGWLTHAKIFFSFSLLLSQVPKISSTKRITQ